jgi:O-antigen ligase
VPVRLPVAPRVLVLAAAIPLLFLHAEFQPSVSAGVGGTTINAYLSDFAILAVVVTALVVLLRDGVAPLRPGTALWAVAVLFFVWLFFEVAWGHRHAASYATSTHAVTALKFLEYALLAPSVALLVRRRADLLAVLWSLVVWSCCATGVGIAEFFGSSVGAKGTVGHRQASFLSSGDFAALSSAVLLVGLVGIGVRSARLPRPLAVVAIVTGVLGTIVAGAMASVLGLGTALVLTALVLLVRRDLAPGRAAAVAAAALVTAGGVVVIRGHDLSAFARFLGASSAQAAQPQTKVQTYAHRTLLVWIGYRIWRDHPLLGVGWEGSAEPANFMPYLPAAKRRFPDEAPQAFPSPAPDRRYGVQNVWVQALADLGVVGCLLWAAVFAAAAWLAVSSGRLLAFAWVALLVWLWSAQGYVAGIPLDALTWLAFGLAAAPVLAAE